MIQHPLLQISKLSVQRGDQFILREICWCIEKGQHWVILGANGSGKTSLLRGLTAYLTPTDGKIVIFWQGLWRIRLAAVTLENWIS